MTQKNPLTTPLIRENPVFKLLLGMCPLLAVTTSAENGLGMGAASTFVLVCSNVLMLGFLVGSVPEMVSAASVEGSGVSRILESGTTTRITTIATSSQWARGIAPC